METDPREKLPCLIVAVIGLLLLVLALGVIAAARFGYTRSSQPQPVSLPAAGPD